MAELEILDSYLPLVAIVGRPNVGKSTLFNRVVRRRKATVLDTPGVTRDRNFERGEWGGRPFMLVDTGGYETEPRDATFEQMREQALVAIDEADVVIFMTDVLEDENPVDRDVANILRRSKKPVILVVNKCDNPKRSQEALSFYSLGFEEVLPIGALAGFGVADMLDRIVELLPEQGETDLGDLAGGGLKIAVVGRPNVGKSSLVNAILQRDRVIVNPMPGTTRDTIDTTFRWRPDAKKGETEPPEERVFTLIDTAGLRRRGKIERGVEKLCTLSAQASLRRCDVAVVMIDAADGLTEQDQRIAGYAHEAFRPTILVVNKWDLVEKDTHTAGKFVKDLRDEMGFLTYAPVVMTSALSGQRVHKVLSLAEEIHASSLREVSTRVLNEWLQDTVKRLSPPWHKGKQLRIKYVTQTGVHPPTFTFFVNNPRVIHFSYERYLVNRLRESFGFKGTPIRLDMRRKGRSKEEWR